MIIVNLWAGPGAGKSTAAAGLFHIMKTNNERCELVTEYAKELVYERRDMTDQLLILAQQNRRLRRLSGVVDWVITDSPIPLGRVFVGPEWNHGWFHEAVNSVFASYVNYNVRIERVKTYQAYGRMQTEVEARVLDRKIDDVLAETSLKPDLTVPGDHLAPQRIYEALLSWPVPELGVKAYAR